MNRRGGQIIAVSLLFLTAGMTMVVLALSPEKDHQHRLFIRGHQLGSGLAGFSGRPMVLVFGDSRIPGWDDFLNSCEADATIAQLLKTTFVGVFVDIATEGEVADSNGIGKESTIIIKDLRGPLLGILEGNFTCEDLLASLDMASRHVAIERSSLYSALLRSTTILDRLVEEGRAGDAENAVRWLEHFEPGTEAVREAKGKARALGLAP